MTQKKTLTSNEKLIVILSVILILVASIIYLVIPQLLSSIRPQNTNFIGLVVKAEGDLRMRFGNSINWKKVSTKDKIYSQSYLFTGPNSSAIYGLLDESTVKLGENSLIFMDFTIDTQQRKESGDDSLALELVEGEMQLNLKDESPLHKIKVKDAIIDITKKQKTVIQFNYKQNQSLDIAVIQGNIDINQNKVNYKVKQGEKVGVTDEEITEPEVVDEKTMDEIKRLAEEDHKNVLEELKKKRQFSNILQLIIDQIKETFL